LRRAENITPRAGGAAIAFGDACDRRVFAFARFRWKNRDLGLIPLTPGKP
jgi:hypothetical protein